MTFSTPSRNPLAREIAFKKIIMSKAEVRCGWRWAIDRRGWQKIEKNVILRTCPETFLQRRSLPSAANDKLGKKGFLSCRIDYL